MIYELAVVAKTGLSEGEIQKVTDMVSDVTKSQGGELMLADEWGRIVLAQATSNGTREGHFLYFIIKGDGDVNKEIIRRLKINESIMRNLILKLGEDDEADKVIKAYKTPYSKKYAGSATDEFKEKEEKGKRKFARSRSCWFTAKKIEPSWKDPSTITWLLNEFGKISPARVSGISRKYQRFINTEVKRARNIGVISYTSDRIAQKA